jgi:hypothetical protein
LKKARSYMTWAVEDRVQVAYEELIITAL